MGDHLTFAPPRSRLPLFSTLIITSILLLRYLRWHHFFCTTIKHQWSNKPILQQSSKLKSSDMVDWYVHKRGKGFSNSATHFPIMIQWINQWFTITLKSVSQLPFIHLYRMESLIFDFTICFKTKFLASNFGYCFCCCCYDAESGGVSSWYW